MRNKIKKSSRHSIKKSPFLDQSKLVPLLKPCALQGNAKAQNYLGLAYLNGIGIEKDIPQAYNYIAKAASKNYANAQYNLGRLYKYGIGCELSFTKAVDWFKTAAANGNQRAAYSLGYMYYKGYGVPQDYKQAVSWFTRSSDPMAQHFLGVCYYFGYGVAINETKAIEILSVNPIVNSKTFLSYVKAHQKEKNEAIVAEAMEDISEEVAEATHINTATSTVNLPQENLTKEEINGEWIGKLVQYDWSGTHIERILPIAVSFSSNTIKLQLGAQEHKAATEWQNGNLYVKDDLTISLDKLYSSNPDELSLDYTLFSLGLEKKTIAEQAYITGYVDSYVASWEEYGQPMSLVLLPKGAEGEENSIDTETLIALAAQEDQFIKLYPVPFNEQLTVQYQLETTASVYAELISLNGTNKTVILPTTEQQAGEYTYTIPVSPSLPKGLYVVRLIAGGQLYTRMIIKENNN